MQSLACVITTWEAVIAKLSRRSASHQGNPLTECDARTYATAIAYTGVLLVDIRSRFQDVASDREIIAWAYNVYSLDVYDVGCFLSDALTLLRNVEAPTSYSWFKRQLSEDYPFTGQFLVPMRKLFQSFLEEPSPEGFFPCSQFLSFMTHLSLRDIDHVDIALGCEYLEWEAALHMQKYPADLLDSLRGIMEEWMGDFQWKHWSPHHGPGAVAGLPRSATMQEKYQDLGLDQLLAYVFSHYAGEDVRSWYPYEPQDLSRQAKVVFVPKSMKTKRGISKEPAGLMYWQQAVKEGLYDYIAEHPYLKRHIDFRDQTGNQLLAMRGDRFSTIDLSSASDSVTYTLGKALFSHTPLWPYIVGTRSTTAVLPDGTVVECEKLAPMGSAICFPIQTLIFSAVVEHAVRRAHATYLGNFPVWRVFGDDIIVATPIYWDVVLILEALHFRVNPSKSFTSPKRFRESCGIEVYDGVDVTPMRISRRFINVGKGITHSHAPQFEGMIDMANAALSHRFSLLRTMILQIILKNNVGVPRFSEDGCGAIRSYWADNYSAPRRWNSSYHRSEYRVAMSYTPSLASEKYRRILAGKGLLDESGWLFETLRQTCERSGDMFHPDHLVHVSRGAAKPKLRNRWLPRWW